MSNLAFFATPIDFNKNEVLDNKIKEAKKNNVITVGLLGVAGSSCHKYCDYALSVPSDSTARVQEIHILIGHILCSLVETELCHA